MIDIGSTIAIASEALSLAPKVAELFNKSTEVFETLRNMKMEEDDMPPILVKIITNESSMLNNLIDQYDQVRKDETADTIEIKNAQLRIAAKICELLTSIAPLKESIDGYDTVRAMFCDSVPAALQG